MKASKFNSSEYSNWRNYGDGCYSERDFQRQKAYDAENAIKHSLTNNVKYDDVLSIQNRVDKICSYKWFKDRWGDHKINVIHKTGRGYAYGSFHRSYIKLPNWAMNDLIILHELAHAITDPKTGGTHGRYWAAAFLELVEKVMGKKDYIILKNSYKSHKVKFSQKKRLSEETKLKMREHMKGIRQKLHINA